MSISVTPRDPKARSAATCGLLRRLKCEDYKPLVATSSIIRPGEAQSGIMKDYIFRHNYPDEFEFFHELFKQHLCDTYGIMLCQKDDIKIARHFGGLSAADGDVLRCAMSGNGAFTGALQIVKDIFSLLANQKDTRTRSATRSIGGLSSLPATPSTRRTRLPRRSRASKVYT